jgi:hypothetical protein
MLDKEAMQGHPTFCSAGQMPNLMWLVHPRGWKGLFSCISLADTLALLRLDAKTKRFQLQAFRKRMPHIRDLVPMLAMQIAHKRSHLAITAYRKTLVETSPVTRLSYPVSLVQGVTLKIPAK